MLKSSDKVFAAFQCGTRFREITFSNDTLHLRRFLDEKNRIGLEISIGRTMSHFRGIHRRTHLALIRSGNGKVMSAYSINSYLR